MGRAFLPARLEFFGVLKDEYPPKPVTVQRPAIVTRIPPGRFNPGNATPEIRKPDRFGRARRRRDTLPAMNIIYTDQHKPKNRDKVKYKAPPFVTDEAPARAEIILNAVRAVQLGRVSAPADHGL